MPVCSSSPCCGSQTFSRPTLTIAQSKLRRPDAGLGSVFFSSRAFLGSRRLLNGSASIVAGCDLIQTAGVTSGKSGTVVLRDIMRGACMRQKLKPKCNPAHVVLLAEGVRLIFKRLCQYSSSIPQGPRQFFVMPTTAATTKMWNFLPNQLAKHYPTQRLQTFCFFATTPDTIPPNLPP